MAKTVRKTQIQVEWDNKFGRRVIPKDGQIFGAKKSLLMSIALSDRRRRKLY